jgi:parvulin-like peptidyl-prolyl isomerase
MWKPIHLVVPGRWFWKKALLVGVVAGVGVLAFSWGRRGALSQAQANPTDQVSISTDPKLPSDYSKRAVAFVYGNMAITREDLGEYLIARFGAQRLDFLVNRRIVEMACKAKGIYVTDQEVEAQLQRDLKSFGAPLTLDDFVNKILRRFNKTLFEWKEDVIRPKLALAKLVRPNVKVTDEDLRNAFEARYGEKVECRVIILAQNDAHKHEIWNQVSKSEEAFSKYAKEQANQQLGSQGGKMPPIPHHCDDPNFEREAFNLKPGDVSPLIQLPSKEWCILKCDKRIPPDTSATLERERLKLMDEILEFKIAQEVPKVFKVLRDQAMPQILLHGQEREADLVRNVERELNPAAAPRPTPPPIK